MKSQINATYQLIDFWVGNRLHYLRRSFGYSVGTVADVIDLSEDRLEDIERGHARVSMTDLNILCEFFNVTVTEFFDDAIVLLQNLKNQERESPVDPKEGLNLLRHFTKIKSPEQRQRLLRQAKLFSSLGDDRNP